MRDIVVDTHQTDFFPSYAHSQTAYPRLPKAKYDCDFWLTPYGGNDDTL